MSKPRLAGLAVAMVVLSVGGAVAMETMVSGPLGRALGSAVLFGGFAAFFFTIGR